MVMATFPLNIYSTRRAFSDCSADDMRYGDISEHRLKHEFDLINISNVVDPYTMTRLNPFHNPQSRFSGALGSQTGEKLTPEECANLLFAEMQTTSLPFAMVGPQRFLINKMLEHFRRSTGMPFCDMSLDMAYRDQIINDRSEDSTRQNVIDFFNKNMDYKNHGISKDKIHYLTKIIAGTVLPKFDSLADRINGLGITVHDVHATQIEVMNLEVSHEHWHARLKYKGQDHFGLDTNDILKIKFRQF
ncbi:conserved hypothetical protein [Candidatus Pantoea floridensis]|uniref:Uncharacterized protein n=1 Tax=Candidatus Pantoea floridensis TaxID=1938870 RepID=A0A286BUF6_9GAMM|nr:uncharacterized protein (TIGR03034 family) [Enterobacteriaceae bacterium JKS000233]SOD37758.1 conserved hypothetical protein [Pantoea floridensis]